VRRALFSKRGLGRIVRIFILVAAGVVIFLIYVKRSPKAKQAVEDFIRYTSDDLGLRKDQRTSLHLSNTDLEKIWAYEILSGHYPFSNQPPPSQFRKGLLSIQGLHNPALPSSRPSLKSFRVPNTGGKRLYLSSAVKHERPREGTVLDMEETMRHCAFEHNQYVSECLQKLSTISGLGNSSTSHHFKLSYLTDSRPAIESAPLADPFPDLLFLFDSVEYNPTLIYRPPFPKEYAIKSFDDHEDCVSEYQPKIFHIFWTGPFTDKPYTAAVSFLYSQNIGLHLAKGSNTCPPRLWFWLVPGSAYSSLNPAHDAHEQMMNILSKNRWASPLLDKRFSNVISFHLFNTTEQLDAIPELRENWRLLPLFKSGSAPAAILDEDDPRAQIAGSQSADTYDRLAVVLSDMARFVLCHRFGGIYLDADTLLLRDFEDLWNWPGAFAYRWSRMREYNTAIMKMKWVIIHLSEVLKQD